MLAWIQINLMPGQFASIFSVTSRLRMKYEWIVELLTAALYVDVILAGYASCSQPC
jgi:hypothetical protein